jgi:hypothetical protein
MRDGVVMEFVQRHRRSENRFVASGYDDLRRSARVAKHRHSGLFEAVHRLDAQVDEAARRELSDWIRSEYHREFGDIPLGFVALCYLGPPYIDHRLDLIGSIVDHFSAADRMPDPFQQARMLVRASAYDFIEVYGSGKLVAVRSDGTSVTVEE